MSPEKTVFKETRLLVTREFVFRLPTQFFGYRITHSAIIDTAERIITIDDCNATVFNGDTCTLSHILTASSVEYGNYLRLTALLESES